MSRSRSLFAAGFFATLSAVVACGGNAFSPGDDAHGEDASLDAPADGLLADGAVDCEACPQCYECGVISPPEASAGGSKPVDAGAGDGDLLDADAEPTDAAAGAGFDAPDAAVDSGLTCTPAEKLCGSTCEALSDPTVGCSAASCTACSLPHVSADVCGADGGCAIGACAVGYKSCNASVSDGCETDITQPAHCGDCNTVCPTSAPYCVKGTGSTWSCSNDCPTSAPDLCASSCVNEQSDPNHCGGCSKACPGVTHGSPTCSAGGVCGFTCNSGYSPCNGACVDLAHDPSHCGACATTCGAPTSGTGTAVCDPTGNTGTCDVACGSGLSKCGSAGSYACYSFTSDPAHCGGCNTACSGPKVGSGSATCDSAGGGTCDVTCGAGLSKCGSVGSYACYDFTSVSHCGGCDTVCAAPTNGNGTAKCDASGVSGSASTCDVACSPSYSRCGAGPGAYTCNDLSKDDDNCKTCGSKCPAVLHGVDHCVSSACSISCDSNYHLCGNTCYPNTDLPTDDACVIGETYGVFVSQSMGLSSGANGTRAKPYKTIAAGLAAIGDTGKRLYVCAETYAEAVTVPSTDVWMFGYFDCAGGTWTVGNGRAKIQSPTSPAVYALDVDTPTRFEGFDVVAPDVSAMPGASSIGMLIRNSGGLSLVNDVIKSSNAGAGVDGVPGTAPTATSCAVSDGVTPPAGADGVPGAAQYLITGYVGSAASAGQSGSPGHGGAAGGAGTCAAAYCTVDTSHLPETCKADKICGYPGTNGCGGPGGALGGGGTGGGASIALYVWGSSTVSLSGTTLQSAHGGNGGRGYPGGAGAASWSMSAGAAGAGRQGLRYDSCGTPTTCSPSGGQTFVNVTGGVAGGNGARGSSGGSGAGGSGGDSYAYVAGGGSNVTVSGGTLTAGTPGAAGAGGAATNGGIPGASGASLTK